MQDKTRVSCYVFDCNIWIKILTENHIEILDTLSKKNLSTYISSYGVVETLRVLKRISQRMDQNPDILENYFWNILNHPCIQKEFNQPMTESFILEIKKLPEFIIIAKTFGLEQKDVPYIILGFQHNAIIVTNDKRSILDVAERLQQILNLKVQSWDEFMCELGLKTKVGRK